MRLMFSRRGGAAAGALPLILAARLLIPAADAGAQGILRRVGNAAKEVALTSLDAAAELSLSKASPVDLASWDLVPVPLTTGIALGVAGVDIVDTVGVRVRAYLENATDVPLKVRVPDEKAFAMVDARGRSLRLLSRMRVNGRTGQGEVSVPGGKRVPLVLLYGPTSPDADRATLQLNGRTAIAELPVRMSGVAQGAATGGNAFGEQGGSEPPAWTPPPQPQPHPQPAPAPAQPKRAPTKSTTAGPNFVGTYFSWGMINTKLLILANGSWETAQSRGKWTRGGGRMIVLDGNAQGWCGGRGILNDDETQLSFDCVSKDGFPMNISFAKHSKEIER